MTEEETASKAWKAWRRPEEKPEPESDVGDDDM